MESDDIFFQQYVIPITSTCKNDSTKKIANETEEEIKKCRYFDTGYCKFKLECKFSHPTETCKTYLEGLKCDRNVCKMRHPKECKWFLGITGCKRRDCDFLHVSLARGDGQRVRAHKTYPCAGCKNSFEDVTCVVQHTVQNTNFFLCLNSTVRTGFNTKK